MNYDLPTPRDARREFQLGIMEMGNRMLAHAWVLTLLATINRNWDQLLVDPA